MPKQTNIDELLVQKVAVNLVDSLRDAGSRSKFIICCDNLLLETNPRVFNTVIHLTPTDALELAQKILQELSEDGQIELNLKEVT